MKRWRRRSGRRSHTRRVLGTENGRYDVPEDAHLSSCSLPSLHGTRRVPAHFARRHCGEFSMPDQDCCEPVTGICKHRAFCDPATTASIVARKAHLPVPRNCVSTIRFKCHSAAVYRLFVCELSASLTHIAYALHGVCDACCAACGATSIALMLRPLAEQSTYASSEPSHASECGTASVTLV